MAIYNLALNESAYHYKKPNNREYSKVCVKFLHLRTDVTQRVVFAIDHMPFLRPSASTSFLMRND